MSASALRPVTNGRRLSSEFMIFIAKSTALGTLLGAVSVDTTAQRIVLYGAAIVAVGTLWRYGIKPLGMIIRHSASVVKRTASAVELLERLPERWRENDQRLSDLESEVGIAHSEIQGLDGKIGGVANQVEAIRREFGISDDKIRGQSARAAGDASPLQPDRRVS